MKEDICSFCSPACSIIQWGKTLKTNRTSVWFSTMDRDYWLSLHWRSPREPNFHDRAAFWHLGLGCSLCVTWQLPIMCLDDLTDAEATHPVGSLLCNKVQRWFSTQQYCNTSISVAVLEVSFERSWIIDTDQWKLSRQCNNTGMTVNFSHFVTKLLFGKWFKIVANSRVKSILLMCLIPLGKICMC